MDHEEEGVLKSPVLPLSACALLWVAVLVGCASDNTYRYKRIKTEYADLAYNLDRSQAADTPTATSMIGMIALGGIVIRNAIVLIEFIQDALKQRLPFEEAILQSGAIRMRPILLTAATTALGAWPITLVVILATYYALYRKRHSGIG